MLVVTVFYSVLSEYFSCFRRRSKLTARFMTKLWTCPPYPLCLCQLLIPELIMKDSVRNTA